MNSCTHHQGPHQDQYRDQEGSGQKKNKSRWPSKKLMNSCTVLLWFAYALFATGFIFVFIYSFCLSLCPGHDVVRFDTGLGGPRIQVFFS